MDAITLASEVLYVALAACVSVVTVVAVTVKLGDTISQNSQPVEMG